PSRRHEGVGGGKQTAEGGGGGHARPPRGRGRGAAPPKAPKSLPREPPAGRTYPPVILPRPADKMAAAAARSRYRAAPPRRLRPESGETSIRRARRPQRRARPATP